MQPPDFSLKAKAYHNLYMHKMNGEGGMLQATGIFSTTHKCEAMRGRALTLKRLVLSYNYTTGMRLRLLLHFILFLVASISVAQDTTKQYTAIRIVQSPRIDGVLDEPEWNAAVVMNDFVQFLPIEGAKPDHLSEVKIMYDDQAIYIGAMMYDSSPDSILRELAPRDELDINADYFRVAIDPYFKHQDAYLFGVYASGVQFDSKFSDETYDAVWESSVRITDKGWIAELRIPYSAIRFPRFAEQKWSFQVNRSVRRTREFVQWSPTPSKASNSQLYWGTLNGISNIKLPVRLSFTPYLSAYLENAPEYQSNGDVRYNNSFSYNAGADVKYGIDERFTVDMTLLPDFGQVQSDNKVKNLSYREVTYDENRPFFKESVELFDKNKLFYSRRIGKIPSGYFSAESQLNPGERLTENPAQAKLLHAVKLSGRTGGGLGIGLFNAITDNSYAIVKDSSDRERRILTEPLTNFNVIVFEQDLKNNSEVYLINTNVTRDKKHSDANVTGAGFTLSNKKNTFAVEGEGAWSQQLNMNRGSQEGTDDRIDGFNYSMTVRKMGGTFVYGAATTVYDDKYFTSDMGFQTINNRIVYEAYLGHNLHQPWKIFRNSYNTLNYNFSTHYITGKPVSNEISVNLFGTFMNYLSVFAGGGGTLGPFYDYFEPRVPGRFQKSIGYFYSFAGISTDYRKKVAVDLTLNVSNFIDHYVSEGINGDIRIRYRVSDRFTVRLNSGYGYDPYNLGFVNVTDDEDVIYGLRYMNTYINQLTASWIFTKDMYVSLNVRHYWQTAEYRKYLTLQQDGGLEDNYAYDVNHNFNYNAFNIDFVYSWQFAPGSDLSLVYKNAIENDLGAISVFPDYGNNLKRVMNDPQTNSLSLRMIYYFDYLYLKKKK